MNIITTGNGLGFVTIIAHRECSNHKKVSMLTIWSRNIVGMDILVMGNGRGGCVDMISGQGASTPAGDRLSAIKSS